MRPLLTFVITSLAWALAPPAAADNTLISPCAIGMLHTLVESVPASRFAVTLRAIDATMDPTSLHRIVVGIEDGHSVFHAPEIHLSPLYPGEPARIARATDYHNWGRSPEQLAQASLLTEEPLVLLGAGGQQRVYAIRGNVAWAMKAFDPEMMWRNLREALEATHTPEARTQLAAYRQSIPLGGRYPPEINKMITVLLQRQRYLGGILLQEIVPRLNREMGTVRVSMARGLENPTRRGLTRVERIHFGALEPGNPRSSSWVEAESYLRSLPEGSPQRERIQALRGQWNEALRPYNERLAGTNQRLGINLTHNGAPIELDIGNAWDDFANVALLLDADGMPVEIKILDF